jgi:hypothetical protein
MRQHPAERRQHEPVARREPRPPYLPTQDRQFMTQRKDLQLLRPIATREQHQQPEQPAAEHI